MRIKTILILLLIAEAALLGAVITGAGTRWQLCGCGIVLGLTLLFYIFAVRPVIAVEDGINLLKAQDYSSRLRLVGQRDADTIVGLFNDLMDKLKEERITLEEKNYFLNQLIAASQQGIVIMSIDEKTRQTNPAAERMLKEIKMPTLADGGSEMVRSAKGDVYRVIRESFVDRGARRTFYIIESMTEEVKRAERDAYGKIIRIISHEVNNTMGGIDSVMQLMQDTADEDIAEVIESCRERGRNMTEFIGSYTKLVKLSEPQKAAVNLGESIEPLRQFIDGMASEAGISVDYDLERCGTVHLDPVMWQQVIINIVKNSVESIVQSGRADGQISISGKGMELQISDNGVGITEEESQKIFSPFYTTKTDGQGIGLMLVSEILTRHGCKFELFGENSTKKTHFRVTFLS